MLVRAWSQAYIDLLLLQLRLSLLLVEVLRQSAPIHTSLLSQRVRLVITFFGCLKVLVFRATKVLKRV